MKLTYRRYSITQGAQKVKTKAFIAISAIGLLFGGAGFSLISITAAHAAGGTNTVCATTVGTCEYSSLQAAVNAVSSGSTINIKSNLTITDGVTINKSLTIDGNNYTLSPTFTKNGNSDNATLMIDSSNVTVNDLKINGSQGKYLHGINIYEATGVDLNNVITENNNHYGIVVDGSTVEVNNITTNNNGWGGIDVDQGVGVNTPASLTVYGQSTQNETAADIYVDNNTNPNVKVLDPLKQYSSVNFAPYAAGNGDIYPSTAYFLNATVPTAKFFAEPSNKFVPSDGYTNSLHFKFDLKSRNAVRYQLRYWNDIPGSQFTSSSPWNPTNLSSAGHMAQLGTYTDLFTQGQGKHYFSFSACNVINVCTSYSTPYVITYDTTPPVITIIQPTNNTNRSITVYVSNAGNLVVSGTATDNLSGIAYNKLTLAITDVTKKPIKTEFLRYPIVQSNGDWSAIVPARQLTDGDKMIISAAARDGAMNAGSDHVFFTVDDYPTTKGECMDYGWKEVHTKAFQKFRNQGLCVSWVEHNVLDHGTRADNRPRG